MAKLDLPRKILRGRLFCAEPTVTVRIGLGPVHLIVGPSGAGKDTLMERARAALRGDPAFVFARRVVTRKPDRWEDHDSLDPAAFAQAVEEGAFALTWQAHGLRYGLPRSVDDDVAAGRRVVCNVSRAAIAPARARWTNVRVLYVDAPPAALAERLRQRGRHDDVVSRLSRSTNFTAQHADVVIDNSGDLDGAAAAFLAALVWRAAATG